MTALLHTILASLAWATAPLEGAWVLDPGKSESVEAILEAQGVSWAARKAATSVIPKLQITQDESAVRVTSTTPKGTTTEVFPTDGQPHRTDSPDGQPATWTTRWQGDTLVSTRAVAFGPDKQPATLTLSRSRVGEAMHQRVTLVVEGGATHTALRVFVPQ